MSQIPRPSHADFTYQMKYGFRASSGGGRSSARETIGRVAAGAIAEKFLKERYGVEIVSWVSAVGDLVLPDDKIDLNTLSREQVDAHMVRCPCLDTAEKMTDIIKAARADEDSVGGICSVVIRNCPIGLGEPCFDKLEAKLAHAMMSIPATKGFEIGSGFAGAKMRGSAHNDMFKIDASGKMVTTTNYSGGVQGGISNTVPTLPEEISPYFCDPSMNGDISYNGVLKGWPGAENTAANKTTLEAKKAELEAQLAAISLELQK